jgi:zinc transporter ZupT
VLEAALWGLISAGSLLVGAVIALLVRPGNRLVGLTIAFGAGALIAAIAYELVLEGFNTNAPWSAVVAASVVAAAAGWWVLGSVDAAEGAFALGFAAGALLVMLSDTLMPEAFEPGGREAGLLTALGFALGFSLS